jgi:hypothetical protein
MDKLLAGLFLFLGFLALVLIIGLLISWPLMLLWNGCLVGTVAGIGPLTSIWHAWGILILSAFLFKSTTTSSK